MYKILFCSFLMWLLPYFSNGQVVDGLPGDSTIIRFSNSMPNYMPDTAASPLWQIGLTHKTFFETDTSGTRGMMTDTLHPYRANANNWFVLKIVQDYNVIVDFWHKYETDSTRDGGTVEYSIDHGATWQNMLGSCNSNGMPCEPGIKTSNFYSATDTLVTGLPSFNGSQDSVQYSRFQFFGGCPLQPTSSCELYADTFYVRFRFVSDSVSDTLAGWIIDSFKIEHDIYLGSVAQINTHQQLKVSPNPSADGFFQFPALENEQNYTTEVYNAMGEKMLSLPYCHNLDLANYAKGLYFYRVTNGRNYYSGKLMVE